MIICGGTGAVSAAVETSVDALPGVTSVREGGVNRYDTAALIAGYGMSRTWSLASYVAVATGVTFPDALSGSSVAGSQRGVLLLTTTFSLPLPSYQFLVANKSQVTSATVLGGTGPVDDAVLSDIAGALQ